MRVSGAAPPVIQPSTNGSELFFYQPSFAQILDRCRPVTIPEIIKALCNIADNRAGG